VEKLTIELEYAKLEITQTQICRLLFVTSSHSIWCNKVGDWRWQRSESW